MTSLNHRPRRLRHAPTGRLFAQDGLSVPVSITQRSDDIVLVILDGAEEFISNPLSLLMLESAGSRGIVRTSGSAELIEQNLLRFVLDDHPELVQRREYVRVVAAKRVVFADEEGEKIADALTVDLSGGGMLVQLPRSAELPVDEPVRFTVYLGLTDYDDQVCGSAHVIRTNPDRQVAMVFDHISHSDQERLIRFVFERQRVALRVTRGDTI
jgi:hypothetical protein